MCGIAGILRFDNCPVKNEDLSRILQKLSHRGRDSECLVIGSASYEYPGSISRRAEIGLGHRRLAIIDLSDSAIQPMSYAEGQLWLTFNGEIYNYIELRLELERYGCKFKTHSDTEVILAAYEHWGESCVDHFNGMYAMVLWDEIHGKLFAARDPLGIKPFYYLITKDYFAFASESCALAHLTGKKIDPYGLAAYMLGAYVPGPRCIFQDIHKLMPGHSLTVSPDGRLVQKRFWKLSDFETTSNVIEQQTEIEGLLHASVKRQLRSDVPVGAFLSGGVDSSLLVALSVENASVFHTFSVGFEGLDVNELPYARQVAERYGTRHHELTLTASMVMKNLDKALMALSEPVADSAIVPTFILSEMAAAEGVKVMLSGTGGDEVFGGYTRYVGNTFKRKMLLSIPYNARIMLGKIPLLNNTLLGMRFRHLALDLMANTNGSHDLSRRLFKSSNEFIYFIEELATECFPLVDDEVPMLYNLMQFDLCVYLADELLLLLDQMTMSWTIEGRVPLLDVDVIKSSFKLPVSAQVDGGQTKLFLKKLAAPYLGKEFVSRKKQGFGAPVQFWVNQNLSEMLEVVSQANQVSYLNGIDVDRYCRKRNGSLIESVEANEIFILYCFLRWLERLKEF